STRPALSKVSSSRLPPLVEDQRGFEKPRKRNRGGRTFTVGPLGRTSLDDDLRNGGRLRGSGRLEQDLHGVLRAEGVAPGRRPGLVAEAPASVRQAPGDRDVLADRRPGGRR